MDPNALTVVETPTLPIGVILACLVFALLSTIFSIVVMWKLYYKAGYDGWKCLIPFYNIYIMVKIAGFQGWLFLLFLIPFVGQIFTFVLIFNMGKKFGGTAMGVFFLIPMVNLVAIAYCAFSYNIEYAFED